MIRNVSGFLVKIFFGLILQVDKKQLPPNLEKTCRLYQGDSFTGLFSRIRVWDAPFEQVEKLVPKKGLVLDLGCGDGLLANYLAISGPQRKIIGVDLNKERIKHADKGLRNTEFIYGDVLKERKVSPDVILMSHVLHHLNSLKTQETLIRDCVNNLKTGGKLIVLEIKPNFSFEYLVTLIADYTTYPMLFEKKIIGDRVYYRQEGDWIKLLLGFGLKVRKEKVTGKPFSHMILVAEKVGIQK